MAWLENEDAALKRLLNAITVVDKKSATRSVQVWFGLPDPEVRPVTWPHITIDLINLEEARERVMTSNPTNFSEYIPEGAELPDTDTRLLAPWPQPYNIDYQVTTFARIPQHDRQLLLHLLTDELPARFGQVAEDQTETNRRLDLIGFRKADLYDKNEKRVFRNIFTVRMSSELFLTPATLTRIVDEITITPPSLPDFYPVFD